MQEEFKGGSSPQRTPGGSGRIGFQ